LPNQPHSQDFGENLAQEGFYVLQPRYLGSWESSGSFSIENCLKTVMVSEKIFLKKNAVESYSQKEITWDIKDIYILGSSFAPAIILSILHKLKTKKIICLSPLTDLTKHNSDSKIIEQDLNFLYGFLKRGFGNAFRNFRKIDWDKFVKGRSKANPIEHCLKFKDKQIFLLHGDLDKTVSIKRTKEYYNKIKLKNKVEFRVYHGIGHGKQLKKTSFKDIITWIKSN